MDKLRIESYLLEVIAKRAGLSLEDYLVELGRRDIARMKKEAPVVFKELMADLGRQVYEGGFDEEAPSPSRKKRCTSCKADKGYRAFDGGGTVCRKCVEKAEPPAAQPEPANEPDNSAVEFFQSAGEPVTAPEIDPEPVTAEEKPSHGLRRCSTCKQAKMSNVFDLDGDQPDVCLPCQGIKPGTTYKCMRCGEHKARAQVKGGICRACHRLERES